MAFKPSSAPHSTGASGTSSLHSVGDPDYDHFLEKTKLSHSSNEVLTTRSPASLHISPTPTPPTSARRDRGNPISTPSSKSKGQASTSATTTSRDNEVLKYSEFLPKLVQERQRLETELKLLATQHRAIKKRRRTLQRLTKERVLKIQPPPPPQQAPARPSAWAEHSSPKSGTKRQVKIMAPRETHGVFAMLGLSTASLGTKDRERERERERANTTISSSSTVKKERRSTTTNAVHSGEMTNATTTSAPTTTTQQQTSFSASATPTKVAGSMAGGFARNMVAAGQFASSPAGLNRASGPLATKAGHGHLQGSPRQALTNSSAVATPGPAEEDDGEGRRFFGTSKYRKYEMDVMKDDGFADLFSKFQASGIGHGEDDDDQESEDKRAATDADAGVAAQSGAAEGGAAGELKVTAAVVAATVDSGADSGEKAAVDESTVVKTFKEEESGGGGSSSCEEKEKGGGDSDRERKVAVSIEVVGSGEEETEAEEPAKRAAKRASKRASSLLGSFIEMKRDYQKMLNEFEEKQKDNSIDANEKARRHIAELQAILKQLRREQAALRARVQTSQDDAQLLESFSVGVSLFDNKKKEDEASSKFSETRNRRKPRENAAVGKSKKKKESEDEGDNDKDNDNDEKKQKKKKKKKKEKTNDPGDGDGAEEVDAAVRAKQANALAEYGADSAAFAATVRSGAVAEYGAAASTTTSESSLGFTVVASACGGSATAEYGAAATSTAEYGGNAVAEYGAAAGGGDDGDSNNGDEWDENKKKSKDKRRKRIGSRNKSSSNRSSGGGGGGEGAGKEDNNNNEEDSNGANSSSSTTASIEAAKARKKKRMTKRASVREILLKAYHEIAYEELQFDPKPLGNGAFGVVYKALWRGTPVAVKKLMVMQFTDAEVYNFKREASIMEKYSNHPCIVKFCGISTKFPHYFTEYMERGCVRDALAENPDLPWKTIVGMALDAAAGILHLHAEHIIHRDLALRNMLVGRDWRVRMADFGLARMMPKDTYAKTRGNIGAVRWLAPEVISKSVYSEKSDSYAFGIVMWELLTRGEEPFADMTNVMEVALGIINEGLRPTVPRETPAEYAQLMSDCWARNADDRPDFVQIHRRLKAYHATLP